MPMSDEMAYVVIEGAYDYEPIQVFAGEGAQQAAEKLADDRGDGATVKALPLRSADWVPGEWVGMASRLALISGDEMGRGVDRRTDFSGRYEGRVHCEARLRPGRWVVTTTGDGALVAQAHEKAVAAKRAEILGG